MTTNQTPRQIAIAALESIRDGIYSTVAGQLAQATGEALAAIRSALAETLASCAHPKAEWNLCHNGCAFAEAPVETLADDDGIRRIVEKWLVNEVDFYDEEDDARTVLERIDAYRKQRGGK